MWIRAVAILFGGFAALGVVITVAVGPFFQWYFYDVPYEIPSFLKLAKVTLTALFSAFLAGILAWIFGSRPQ